MLHAAERAEADLTIKAAGVLNPAITRAAASFWSKQHLSRLSPLNVSTVITNVPGPPYQLYMCGAELIDAISLGPLLPNVGLFQIVYSSVQNKKGTITLSFTACRDMMPDPGFQKPIR